MYINPTNPYAFTPLQTTGNVTPFTLRDGASFLEKLEALAKYSVETLPASFADKFVEVVAEFNKSLDATGTVWADDFAAYRADLTGVLAGLNDESMQLLTDNPDSKTGAAIRKLIVMLSASDADLEALEETLTTAVNAVQVDAAAQRKTLDDHSARHEWGGADQLQIDVRQIGTPVRDWVRDKLRNVTTEPFRIVFTGASHTNDGSLEQWTDQPDIWGGGTGYAYRMGNLLTDEGMKEAHSTVNASTETSPGVHTWETAIGGMRSDTYLPTGALNNIAKIQPHLVTHLTGTNDFAAQTPPTTYRANMDKALAAVWASTPNARQLLIIPTPRINPSGLVYPWRDYARELRLIADANKTNPLFELLDLSAPYERLSMPLKRDLWGVYPDGIHTDIRPHREIAERLCEWMGLPSPLAIFGPTRVMRGSDVRDGRLDDANPHSTINIRKVAVPQDATIHVTLNGVCDSAGSIRVNCVEDLRSTTGEYNRTVLPFHVVPGEPQTYSFTRTIRIPAHSPRVLYLAGEDGFTVRATTGNYSQFFVELNYA